MARDEIRRPPSAGAPARRGPDAVPPRSLILVDAAGEPRPAERSLVAAMLRLEPGTQMHLHRVAFLAGELASMLGLPAPARRQAETAGLLHDIGKSVVPTAILQKPGVLTAAERDVLRIHPHAGARLASETDDPVVLDAIRHHHEWVDGRGYPDRLSGDEIGPVTRVVAVADMYDALTSHRPYRRALPEAVALSHLAAVAGTKLDGDMVEALAALRTGAVRRAA